MMEFMGSNAIATILMAVVTVAMGAVLYKGFKVMISEVTEG